MFLTSVMKSRNVLKDTTLGGSVIVRVDSARRHVRVGGDGGHGPDRSVGFPQTHERGRGRGAQQEAGQQGLHRKPTKDIPSFIFGWV